MCCFGLVCQQHKWSVFLYMWVLEWQPFLLGDFPILMSWNCNHFLGKVWTAFNCSPPSSASTGGRDRSLPEGLQVFHTLLHVAHRSCIPVGSWCICMVHPNSFSFPIPTRPRPLFLTPFLFLHSLASLMFTILVCRWYRCTTHSHSFFHLSSPISFGTDVWKSHDCDHQKE